MPAGAPRRSAADARSAAAGCAAPRPVGRGDASIQWRSTEYSHPLLARVRLASPPAWGVPPAARPCPGGDPGSRGREAQGCEAAQSLSWRGVGRLRLSVKLFDNSGRASGEGPRGCLAANTQNDPFCRWLVCSATGPARAPAGVRSLRSGTPRQERALPARMHAVSNVSPSPARRAARVTLPAVESRPSPAGRGASVAPHALAPARVAASPRLPPSLPLLEALQAPRSLPPSRAPR